MMDDRESWSLALLPFSLLFAIIWVIYNSIAFIIQTMLAVGTIIEYSINKPKDNKK